MMIMLVITIASINEEKETPSNTQTVLGNPFLPRLHPRPCPYMEWTS
jgi:hypothetical protein